MKRPSVTTHLVAHALTIVFGAETAPAASAGPSRPTRGAPVRRSTRASTTRPTNGQAEQPAVTVTVTGELAVRAFDALARGWTEVIGPTSDPPATRPARGPRR